MKIIDYSVLLFVLSGCAIDPTARNDFSGLGDSALGKELRNSVFLGEVAISHSIGNIVNGPRTEVPGSRLKQLENFGFTCNAPKKDRCFYDGSATSEIKDPKRAETTRIRTVVHLDAILEGENVKIVSKLNQNYY